MPKKFNNPMLIEYLGEYAYSDELAPSIKGMHRLSRKTPIKRLQRLAQQADRILREELGKEKIEYDFAEARAIDLKSVGVQGDKRTYLYPIEITLFKNSKPVYEGREDWLERLSSRITNEVKGVNRVIYTFAMRADRTI